MTTLTVTISGFPLPKLRFERIILPVDLTCPDAMGGLPGCPPSLSFGAGSLWVGVKNDVVLYSGRPGPKSLSWMEIEPERSFAFALSVCHGSLLISGEPLLLREFHLSTTFALLGITSTLWRSCYPVSALINLESHGRNKHLLTPSSKSSCVWLGLGSSWPVFLI